TGGVGSGKSTILNILQNDYGAEIILADNIGHEALEKDSSTYKLITDHFGTNILDADANIDKAKLAKIIFSNNKEKEFLNSIVHPTAIKRIKEIIDTWKQDVQNGKINQQSSSENKTLNMGNHPMLILESALMFETACDRLCDEIWGIICDTETRIKRLMETRDYTKEHALSIINTQLSDEEIIEKCDHIIYNNGTIEDIKHEIELLLHQ
ncbi:MAG: dephospho-CoA kinase, partial [Eubacterium sp.]|nr:dephospho-CoA kinase [Eubacterium sp.]